MAGACPGAGVRGRGGVRRQGTTAMQALDCVLRLPAVGSKRFLTTKVDRCVTGLVAQQQCVGPLQVHPPSPPLPPPPPNGLSSSRFSRVSYPASIARCITGSSAARGRAAGMASGRVPPAEEVVLAWWRCSCRWRTWRCRRSRTSASRGSPLPLASSPTRSAFLRRPLPPTAEAGASFRMRHLLREGVGGEKGGAGLRCGGDPVLCLLS